RTKQSRSNTEQISPVKGHFFSQYMFCAPTFMFCALPSDSITFAIAVNGGTITTSTSVISPRSSSIDSTNRADSACVIFIFQLAATIFFLMSSNCHYERSEESLDLSRHGKSHVICATMHGSCPSLGKLFSVLGDVTQASCLSRRTG